MYSIEDYQNNKCPLLLSMRKHNIFGVTFGLLYNKCNGNVCQECNYKLHDCLGLWAMLNDDNITPKIKRSMNALTNAEIGEILHMSKRGVAKARRNGTLPKEYI